jgi:hypothetical protein
MKDLSDYLIVFRSDGNFYFYWDILDEGCKFSFMLNTYLAFSSESSFTCKYNRL